jgi:hypothetical protein
LKNIYPSKVSNLFKELLLLNTGLVIIGSLLKDADILTTCVSQLGAIGDELHFLFSCHFLNDNRMKFLQSSLDPTRSHDTSHYIKILSTQNEKKLVSLAKYVSKGFEYSS